MILDSKRYGKVEFGRIHMASGACNFFPQLGFPFHKLWRFFGMTWRDVTRLGKTTTLPPRVGNLPLKSDGITPKEINPRCIHIDFATGHALNCVALSGRGAKFLFDRGLYQQMEEPFGLSFMSPEATKSDRLEEHRGYVKLAKPYLDGFRAPTFQTVNFGCPNTGLHLDDLLNEVGEALDVYDEMGIAIVLNFNALVPLRVLQQADRHPACSGFAICNTLPFDTPGIDRPKLFGSDISPLIKRGFDQPGGISGPVCLPFTIRKVREAREAGIRKPIAAGNGIQRPEDVIAVMDAGADAVSIGIVGIVRPWRMRSIIATATSYYPEWRF